ncbi:pitrilysin family protein [Pseudoalteromonas sp. Of11M-6]|uniref:M16 family metallopeptidase n=1 Tax=Pseudoalteromonas sp. Of11M-6 TaxID=2917754 RepID=UPI001EF43658|nr:pitrilysin family protein [Pseudoalteromonas sp. Of11M-6]MCG7552724.1 insulinase family protein [Pseudoalteromonas sp. Of11M-6]
MNVKPLALAITASLFTLSGCSTSNLQKQDITVQPATDVPDHANSSFHVDFEKFTLDNGLDVVFHIDKSDPVVAVTLAAHVGSAREKVGKTGFAHLFEHLLFLESENLGKGGLDKLSARVGGSGANGSTNRDITNYMQTVPNDALEKMIWAEADKLGYFINTVTIPVLQQEKEVVKNEKRQRVTNQPYGHVFDVVTKNLYPVDHPYNWLPLGSLEDLASATVEDVKDFYKRWYGPNNVTLVISGDFNSNQAKAWVEKYFNDIPRGPEVSPQPKQPIVLTSSKKRYHEDSFAQVPQLTQAWPSMPRFHRDSYAMDVLIKLLTDGNQAPVTNELVEKQKLSSGLMLLDIRSELAGELIMMITAYDGVDLDQVEQAIEIGLKRFETEAFSQDDLHRVKVGIETEYYRNLSSVVNKGVALADYNLLLNDPGYINKEIDLMRAVSADDIWRVYNTYLKNKPFVSTSFVPKGSKKLAVDTAQKAVIKEEQINLEDISELDTAKPLQISKTPSSFDRSIEPEFGKTPVIPTPDVKTAQLKNGLEVFSLYSDEVPLVEIKLTIDGALLLESPDKNGTANLVANMLTRGTATKSAEELNNEIRQLGSTITVTAEREQIVLKASTLARNYEATMALIGEILTQPRWDLTEFELAKQTVTGQLQQSSADPEAIAQKELYKLTYPRHHPLANNTLGTEESISKITIDDLKTYHQKNIAPQLAKLYVAGAVKHADIQKSLEQLIDHWPASKATLPLLPEPNALNSAAIYFYDIPQAKQSTLLIAHPSLKANHTDYFNATAMNYILGGGGFSSRLVQDLRADKGYTYHIRSKFDATPVSSMFEIKSNVRSNVTLESLELVKQIVEEYGNTYTLADLTTTKNYYLKSNARRFETLTAKVKVLEQIGSLNLANNFMQQRNEQIESLGVDDMKGLAKQYIHPNKLIYIVVGDAKTQANRLTALGLGEVIRLN